MEKHHIVSKFLIPFAIVLVLLGILFLFLGKVQDHPHGGFTKKGNGTNQQFTYRKLGLSLCIIGVVSLIGFTILYFIVYEKDKSDNRELAAENLGKTNEKLNEDQQKQSEEEKSVETGKPLPDPAETEKPLPVSDHDVQPN